MSKVKTVSGGETQVCAVKVNKNAFSYRLKRDLRKNYSLYFMLIPVVLFYVIFHYAPMYGVTLGFKDFNPKLGILGSRWIGMDNFRRFFKGEYCLRLIYNTISISAFTLIVGFPIPIIFAVLLNSLNSGKVKKTMQMISYAPHFISVVALCGMLHIFLNPVSGPINLILEKIGFEKIGFLSEKSMFKPVFIASDIWQNMGFNAIIYIAALAGVNYEMHEAAILDGATKLQRIIHIDLPTIMPTIVMLFILRIGKVMNVGFEKVFLLQNSLNMETSDVISTYVYRMGMLGGDYSFSTAVGLFNSLVNIILLLTFNHLAKKTTKSSLW